MVRRIIPVSSGKGGVGKTTCAINLSLALSRAVPTILVDLDTGTSSVRNTLDVPIERDLYHFHRRGVPLADCVTRLGSRLDPDDTFRNFGFVAGPQHYIEELAHPDAALRRRLGAAIAKLPAELVVVDLRAGLDAQVLDFLPHTNAGILIFSPHHPAATRAASDLVKAIIFRALRTLFAADSPIFASGDARRYASLVEDILGRVEDVYDPALPNLEAFLDELEEAFGRHPILEVIAAYLGDFKAHYVLNMFDGVEESYEQAIAPFARNLADNVSPRLDLRQLGWVVRDEQVDRANTAGRPIVLGGAPSAAIARPPTDRVAEELGRLEAEFGGGRRSMMVNERPRSSAHGPARRRDRALVETQDLLAGQLRSLTRIYAQRSQDTLLDNFTYLAHRVLELVDSGHRSSELGMTSMATRDHLLSWFLRWQRAYGG
ncbi:MAG: P-loop NTPase [Acidobacteriota bacterium]